MTDKNIKTDLQQKSSFNAVAAAVTGVIVGAGAVAAGVMVLKDKNNAAKVQEKKEELKNKIADSGEVVAQSLQDEKESLVQETNNAKQKVKKIWQK